MIETTATPEQGDLIGELTPRQIALRDGLADADNGLSERRKDQQRAEVQKLSRQQATLYQLIRLRDHQASAPDIGPEVMHWITEKINRAIRQAEQRCAEQQTVIDTLRAAR